MRCGLVLVRECLRSGDRWGTGLPLQALQEGTGTGSPVQPGGSRRPPGRLSSSRWVDWAALPLPGRGRNLPRSTGRADSKKLGPGRASSLRRRPRRAHRWGKKRKREGERRRRPRSRGAAGAPWVGGWQNAFIAAKRAFSRKLSLGSFSRRQNNASVGFLEVHEPDPGHERTSKTRSSSRRAGSWIRSRIGEQRARN